MPNPHDTAMFLPSPLPSGLTSNWKKYIIQGSTPNDTRLNFNTEQKNLVPRSDLTSFEFPSWYKPNTNNLGKDVDIAFMRTVTPSFPIWLEKIKVCLHQETTYGCVKVNVWDFGDSEDNIPVNLLGLTTPLFKDKYDNYDNYRFEDVNPPPYDILIFYIIDEAENMYYDLVDPVTEARGRSRFFRRLEYFRSVISNLEQYGIRIKVIPIHPPSGDPNKPYIAHPDFTGDDNILPGSGWGISEDGNRVSRPALYSELKALYDEVVEDTRTPPYIALYLDNSGSMVPGDMEPGLSQFKTFLSGLDTTYSYHEENEDWLRHSYEYLESLDADKIKGLVEDENHDDLSDALYNGRWFPQDPSCLESGCDVTVELASLGTVTFPDVYPITDNIPTTIFSNETLVSNALADPDLYMVQTDQECYFDPFSYTIQPNSILRFGIQYAEGNAYGLKVFLIGWALECD